MGLIIFSSPGGIAKINPIRSLITGPRKSLRVDKRLKKTDVVIIKSLPVPGNNLGHPAQKMRCQTGNSYPGQDEKSTVVSNKVKVLFTNIGLPTDKLIPASNMPGRRRPTQTCYRSLLRENNIF